MLLQCLLFRRLHREALIAPVTAIKTNAIKLLLDMSFNLSRSYDFLFMNWPDTISATRLYTFPKISSTNDA